MSKMNVNFIDMVLTSPPYDNIRSYGNDIHKKWNEFVWKPIISELFRVVKIGGVVVWIVGDATIDGSETGTSFKQALWAMECGFKLHDTMMYCKNNPLPSSGKRYQNFPTNWLKTILNHGVMKAI
jgi:site-specific DNA-methyltransferase (adenine-specific)